MRRANSRLRRTCNAAPPKVGLRASPLPAGLIAMNNIVYLVGLIVIVIAILSFFGLR